MSDAFQARLGLDQGRINPSGNALFVLGSSQDGWEAEFNTGDFAEVSQEVDVTALDLIKLHGTLKAPADTNPLQEGWQVSIRIDATPVLEVNAWRGRTLLLSDMAVDVSGLTGTHTIAIRLAFIDL